MFLKDLQYPHTKDLESPESVKRALSFAAADAGTYLRLSSLMLQVKEGAQMWVNKEVSDDLQLSEINPDEISFGELVWPAHRLEVYFQDPSIPTFLALKQTNAEQFAAVDRLTKSSLKPPEGVTEDELHKEFIHLQAMCPDTSIVSVTYTADMIDSFARGEEMPETEEVGFNTRMADDEELEMRRLLLLYYRVLLFIGAEGVETRRTREQPSRREGGKAGFKNRPSTERIIVEYLPRQIAERRQQAEEARRTHKFNGRRGHFRVFRAECFTHMKGKRKFIFPVPGSDGSIPRKRFIVRKPVV